MTNPRIEEVTHQSLVERKTKIYLSEYEQHIYLIEQFNDKNVCIRSFFVDWGGEDITSSLSQRTKTSLYNLQTKHT